MNYVKRILAIYFISAHLFSSIYAGLLLNLLLGGNNQAPEQGLNLSFGNLGNNINNNQEAQNDYPDYNIGTSRNSTLDRPNNFQEQNYSPEGTNNFDQQPQDYHQNKYSGSQEYNYNKESPRNEEEQRIGSSEAGTSTVNQNIPRQQTNVDKNYKAPAISKPKINSTPTKIPLEVKKTITSQNSTVHNLGEKNNFSNSDTGSSDALSLTQNNWNMDTKKSSDNVLKEVAKNNIKIKSKGEGKSVDKTKDINVLKPLTKRKFFFQVKPVMPYMDVSTNKETIFYIESNVFIENT